MKIGHELEFTLSAGQTTKERSFIGWDSFPECNGHHDSLAASVVLRAEDEIKYCQSTDGIVVLKCQQNEHLVVAIYSVPNSKIDIFVCGYNFVEGRIRLFSPSVVVTPNYIDEYEW